MICRNCTHFTSATAAKRAKNKIKTRQIKQFKSQSLLVFTEFNFYFMFTRLLPFQLRLLYCYVYVPGIVRCDRQMESRMKCIIKWFWKWQLRSTSHMTAVSCHICFYLNEFSTIFVSLLHWIAICFIFRFTSFVIVRFMVYHWNFGIDKIDYIKRNVIAAHEY